MNDDPMSGEGQTGSGPAAQETPKADAEPSAAEGRRRSRGRRGGRRHRPAGVAVAPEGATHVAQGARADGSLPDEPAPDAPPAAGPGAAAAAAETPLPLKPRRRRSPRKAAAAHGDAAEGDAAEGEAAELPAERAPAAPGAREEPAAETTGAAGGAAEPAGTGRRRRRGGRRHKTSAQRGVEAAEAPAAPLVEVETVLPAVPPPAEPVGGPTQGGEEVAAAAMPTRKRAPRRKKAAGPAEPTTTTGAAAEAGAAAAGESPEAPRKTPRRRRAPRGKQAEGLPAEPATTAVELRGPASGDEEAGGVASKGGGAEETKPRRRRSGRRQSPNLVTAAAGVERQVLASQEYGQLRVVLLEDGRLAEVYFERPEKPSYLGNIYQARVVSVLRGMDAAFVDFGLEKNGFLHVDEVTAPEDGGARRGKRITQLLQAGQELLVQVTKDPMGSKGARLTTRMSLAGRYLVYVPNGSGVGVSRRLPQEERDRLREICRELKAKDAGLIVRTVAEGKGLEELRRDQQYLSRQWSRIRTKAEKTRAPGLVHAEVDIALSVARDLFNESCTRFVVDSEKLRKELAAYVERVAPELADRVELYDGELPLFDAYGIEDQIERTLARRVTLPSGGNIVVDHAEALTVIDVNSGRYTGGSGLEDTITTTNLEAASEVVHQLRLRDIGGIIVIDFIDMERAENREAVLARLEAELARDRTKTYVVEISPLGLVEMTRQNTTDGARGILTKTCPCCQGTARVLSEETVARRVERELMLTAASLRGAAALIEVSGGVAQRLAASERIRKLERHTGKRFLFQGSKTLAVDTFEMVATGAVKEIEAQCIPVAEGVEIDVELEHSLTYSPKDAVAVVEGYPLVVRNGRQFLGQRRRVRVETALRSGGAAVIVGPAGPG